MASAEYRLCDVAVDCSFRTRDARVERTGARDHRPPESNTFTSIGHDGGRYRLKIETADGHWRCTLPTTTVRMSSATISRSPLRRLLKDYTRICDSFYDVIRRPGPEQLEAIDMGRRQGYGASAVHADLRAPRPPCRV
ncbi:UPF0262 family protein [Sinorhizobium meliloti]|nr:UPF0262 family protein [Sinorhizobium meliloti]